VVAQLRELRSGSAQPEAWAWVDRAEADPATDDLPTDEFLRLAGEGLRRGGTTLAVLDIDSDGYPLVLLPATQARELVELATLTGFGAYEVPAPGA
jgi:hypothetical protein